MSIPQRFTDIADEIRAGYSRFGATGSILTDTMTPAQMPDRIEGLEQRFWTNWMSGDTVDLSWTDITSIPNFAFTCSPSSTIVKSYILPPGLSSLGDYAFQNAKLGTVTFTGNGLVALTGRSFSYSTIAQITLPEGLYYILSSTFEHCFSLTTVTLPSTLIEMSAQVFIDCTGLTAVYCKAGTPPDCMGNNPFTGTPLANGQGAIYVPRNSLSAYQQAPVWSNYSSVLQPYDFT